jgi:hypothetical protein
MAGTKKITVKGDKSITCNTGPIFVTSYYAAD